MYRKKIDGLNALWTWRTTYDRYFLIKLTQKWTGLSTKPELDKPKMNWIINQTWSGSNGIYGDVCLVEVFVGRWESNDTVDGGVVRVKEVRRRHDDAYVHRLTRPVLHHVA